MNRRLLSYRSYDNFVNIHWFQLKQLFSRHTERLLINCLTLMIEYSRTSLMLVFVCLFVCFFSLVKFLSSVNCLQYIPESLHAYMEVKTQEGKWYLIEIGEGVLKIWIAWGCATGGSKSIPISRVYFSNNRYPFLGILPQNTLIFLKKNSLRVRYEIFE